MFLLKILTIELNQFDKNRFFDRKQNLGFIYDNILKIYHIRADI